MQHPTSNVSVNVPSPTGPPTNVAWDTMSDASTAARSAVRAGRYSEHRAGEVKLHVCNLPYSTSHWQVGALFGFYGEVLEAFVFKRPHVSNGCRSALVRMASAEAAGRALNGLDNYNWRGNTLRVRISYHDAPNAAVVPSASGVMVFTDSITSPDQNSPMVTLNSVPVAAVTTSVNFQAPKLDARAIDAANNQNQNCERLSVPAWVSEVEPMSPLTTTLSRQASFTSNSSRPSSATQSPLASAEFKFPSNGSTVSCQSSGSSNSLNVYESLSIGSFTPPQKEEVDAVFVHNPYSLARWAAEY